MKQIQKKNNKNIFKNLFIKICRLFGYEIIDQANFYVPTSNKKLNESLSIIGKKSIIIPSGEIKISRPVKEVCIIFRSGTNANILNQSKERIFEEKKYEYTLRSLYSIIRSLNHAKDFFSKINFKLIVVDDSSKPEITFNIKSLLRKSNSFTSFVDLKKDEFEEIINKTNNKNELITKNQISMMSNFLKSLYISKEKCSDLIYFVEDDYLHELGSIKEMIFTFERISSILKKDIFLCSSDYPFLYNKLEPTKIFLGETRHWRTVDESLCTFFTSKEMIIKYWDELTLMCKLAHDPFETPLHKIYQKEFCLSPIPSLSIHFTNINSSFGLSPNYDWKKIWEENDYK